MHLRYTKGNESKNPVGAALCCPKACSNWRYAVVGTLPEFVIYVTAKLLN
jgi:hypothetical protein